MKTAKEYLKIWKGESEIITEDIAIIAMKEYAKQALELAAEKAQVEFEEPDLIINDDGSREYFRNPIVNEKSILKLKEQLR